jgi:hypothetical protein
MNVLFADDDWNRFLAPLARIIRARPHVNLKTAATFRESVEIIDEARADNRAIQSVLLDIILPYDLDGRGALLSDLGIELADKAAVAGASKIAFLTVVRHDEIADKISELKKRHKPPSVQIRFYDKTELLSGSELMDLVDFIAPKK